LERGRGFESRRSPFNTGWYAADKCVLQKIADAPPDAWVNQGTRDSFAAIVLSS
jgi:hypothetical protein